MHNLIETGTSGLLSDQQLAASNSALILAQSDTARARARVQRIEYILATDDVDAVVTDILDSAVANDLRKNISNPQNSKRKSQAGSAATMFRRCVCATKCRNIAD